MSHHCKFTSEERQAEILKVMRQELRKELDDYFNQSPFMVAAEQHYQDHKFVLEVRTDLHTVKKSFLRKLGTVLALLVTGGLSWKYLAKYFMEP